MVIHRARLTDDSRLALAFAALGFPEYPATNLSVESLTEFKKLVDANWGEKLAAHQKARAAWAGQPAIQPTNPLAVAQSKLDEAEAAKRMFASAWERMTPEVQESVRHFHEHAMTLADERIAQARANVVAAENLPPVVDDDADEKAVAAAPTAVKLREAFDATFAEMMDARRAEELARALPQVWAGDEQATAWFERQVAIVKAYSPKLEAVL